MHSPAVTNKVAAFQSSTVESVNSGHVWEGCISDPP